MCSSGSHSSSVVSRSPDVHSEPEGPAATSNCRARSCGAEKSSTSARLVAESSLMVSGSLPSPLDHLQDGCVIEVLRGGVLACSRLANGEMTRHGVRKPSRPSSAAPHCRRTPGRVSYRTRSRTRRCCRHAAIRRMHRRCTRRARPRRNDPDPGDSSPGNREPADRFDAGRLPHPHTQSALAPVGAVEPAQHMVERPVLPSATAFHSWPRQSSENVCLQKTSAGEPSRSLHE